jgi:hypothetical protein
MLLSNYNADPLTCAPCINRVTSLIAFKPSRNLPYRRTITALHYNAL